MAINKLYVGNLNYQVTEEELKEIFRLTDRWCRSL